MKIDKPGEYVMRNGRKFIVRDVDWPGRFPVVGHYEGDPSNIGGRTREGRWSNLVSDHCLDIVDVYRPMIEREGWCNIVRSAYHKDHRCVTQLAIYSTEAGAINGGKASCKEIIATARITWKEPAE